jgi:hypothetical protein
MQIRMRGGGLPFAPELLLNRAASILRRTKFALAGGALCTKFREMKGAAERSGGDQIRVAAILRLIKIHLRLGLNGL